MKNSSQITCIEFSHHATPVAVRERLHIEQDTLAEAYARAEIDMSALDALCILSTCNRVELYATSEQLDFDIPTALVKFVAAQAGVEPDSIRPFVSVHQQSAVATHLLRTACSLESQIIGETQILGQINQAHAEAIKYQSHDPLLNSLFQTAIRTGKRARTETDISRHAASVGSIAVKLAKQTLGELSGKHVVLLGSGAMGQLVLTSLRSEGASCVSLLNRTPANAKALGKKFDALVQPLSELNNVLARADVLIAATGSQEFVVTKANLPARSNRPLLLIDIAVPRNIDPAIAEFENVQLFDMDDLSLARDGGLLERQQAIPAVEAIIDDELARWTETSKQLTARPLISDLHQQADAIREQELRRMLRKLPNDIPDALREQLELFSRSLVNKLLHEPTKQILAEASRGESTFAVSARELFQLKQSEDAPTATSLPPTPNPKSPS